MSRTAAFGLAAVLLLAGCAAMEARQAARTEDLLSAAGFHQVAADKPERVNALASMKPNIISTVVRNKKTYYVYPDPTNCNCLYVGQEPQYQAYKRLEIEKQMADENMMAAEANRDAAMDWGIWGPW
ncbi:MAG TPA: hypothetical protein VMH82_12725 [Myxococcota bacterium]|nr:hypothetical protein [Myxococcota bacterium]